jgi:hypothetical protein
MAIYVEIRKDAQTERGFIYRYIASDGTIGRLEVDSFDGSTRSLEIASGDSDEHFYNLAARKLFKHFQAGEFPDETCWAS